MKKKTKFEIKINARPYEKITLRPYVSAMYPYNRIPDTLPIKRILLKSLL